MTRRTLLGAAAATAIAAPPRFQMGIATTSFMTFRRPKDTLDFLEYCNTLGAGGIQAPLALASAEYARKVRARAERLGMFVEVMSPLPRQDTEAFERVAAAAKQAGALCLRAACLGGRRYETFADLPAWQRFITDSRAAIDRALPILEKHRIRLALENHKDWTAEELAALLNDKSSEWLGVCLDTGNNIALLDDPYAVVETLAPYAISTHIKDMAWEPDPEGFLLSEMPLGEGLLDMKRIVAAIRKAQPRTRMTLEMITRNPLRVPCLAEKYWATFPDRGGRYLAATLRMVRSGKAARELPYVDKLDAAAQLRVEEDNVKQSLRHGREQLGL